MCNKRNSKRRRIRGKIVRLDACITDLIVALNENGIKTLGSCCGHGKYPLTIVYEATGNTAGIEGTIYDFVSGWGIPRKTRFYVRDKAGLFYIPEVVRPLSSPGLKAGVSRGAD